MKINKYNLKYNYYSSIICILNDIEISRRKLYLKYILGIHLT